MEKSTFLRPKLLLFLLSLVHIQESFAVIEARITNLYYQDVKIVTFTDTAQQEKWVAAGAQDVPFATSINECFLGFHVMLGSIYLTSFPAPFCTDARFVLDSGARLYLVSQ